MDSRTRGIGVGTIPLVGVLAWAGTAPPVFAQTAIRSFSVEYYEPAVTLTVTITLDAPPGTDVMVLAGSPPDGWTDVTNISNGGVYDPGFHKVKFGPFLPPFPGVVNYDHLPNVRHWELREEFTGSGTSCRRVRCGSSTAGVPVSTQGERTSARFDRCSGCPLRGVWS